jgi:hypothetical protein
MSESAARMTTPGDPPRTIALARWLGKEAYGYWKQLAQRIERAYPSVFAPDWLFGGRKHGWALRYKKSKSFCTFVPERNRCNLLIVFGAAEREKVETIRDQLSARTRKIYDEAKTYHDGKWMLLGINSARTIEDVMRLLALKRRPKKTSV